jgi:hypothetical protein
LVAPSRIQSKEHSVSESLHLILASLQLSPTQRPAHVEPPEHRTSSFWQAFLPLHSSDCNCAPPVTSTLTSRHAFSSPQRRESIEYGASTLIVKSLHESLSSHRIVHDPLQMMVDFSQACLPSQLMMQLSPSQYMVSCLQSCFLHVRAVLVGLGVGAGTGF